MKQAIPTTLAAICLPVIAVITAPCSAQDEESVRPEAIKAYTPANELTSQQKMFIDQVMARYYIVMLSYDRELQTRGYNYIPPQPTEAKQLIESLMSWAAMEGILSETEAYLEKHYIMYCDNKRMHMHAPEPEPDNFNPPPLMPELPAGLPTLNH